MSENQKLSPAKFGLLGFQHMFAMFGATVLVPALTGLSVSATLLFAGLGTLLFHLLTKGKVPAFLGSSFAFLGGYFAIAGMEQFADGTINWIPYAGVGVACAGLIYCVVAALFKVFGAEKVMRFFPPIVTGPILIAIGLILSNSAVNNCATNWPIAILALVIVVAFNIWGKGMLKIIPILLGDGCATALAALFGAPANTTYGENTGVLALTRVYNPAVVRMAAVLAIFFSFCPKFAALISCMPAATIGGVSLILYGMISAVGVRNIVENQVDFTKSRNVIIAALIIALALGINFSSALGCDTVAGVSGAISFTIAGVKISLSGLAVASLVGIILNAVLPGNDYKFGDNEQGDQAVNFKV